MLWYEFGGTLTDRVGSMHDIKLHVPGDETTVDVKAFGAMSTFSRTQMRRQYNSLDEGKIGGDMLWVVVETTGPEAEPEPNIEHTLD